MKVFSKWVSFVFLLIVVGFPAIGAEEEKKTVAMMVIEQSTHDFGQVSQGELVRHEFKVFNKGDAPLEIKSVKPG